VSRSLSLGGLLLAWACLTVPLPTYAAEHPRAGTSGRATAPTYHSSKQQTGERCSSAGTSATKTSRKGSAKRPTSVRKGAHCVTRSRLRAHVSRTTHSSSMLYQFGPHSVGHIFGVGSFLTQRSWTISPLIVGRARELGTQWVREEFTASRLHADTTGKYRWADYDRIVNQERKGGLQILGLLDYSNTWTFHDHGTMPHRDIRQLASDFARYTYDVVRHFRGRIRYWEIWNEPNVDAFWHPTPDADDYATLLDAAGSAVKRADRHSQVVLAGTSGIDLSFIRAVVARTHRFDVLAVHPYRNLPEQSFLKQVKALRSLHKPIWFSEIGWPAGAGCASCAGEVEQARYLVRFYTLAAAAGIQRVFWYDLRDDPHAASNPEAHFGLLRRDLSGKPAFVAYAYLSRLLNGSRYVGADWLGRHGLYTVRFQRGSLHVAVLWNTSNTNRKLTVNWKYHNANFVTAGGDVLAELTPSGGHVSVIAPQGGEPFYLVDRLPDYRVPELGALLHAAPPKPRTTPRPTARATRSHSTSDVGKVAWRSPSRHKVALKSTATPAGAEHRVSPPMPRATLTVSPSFPVSTPPPAP
jgi:hypothetical protein